MKYARERELFNKFSIYSQFLQIKMKYVRERERERERLFFRDGAFLNKLFSIDSQQF